MSTKKITKKAFLAAAKKGWRKLGWIELKFWADKDGDITWERKEAVSACAIGAAAYALKVSPIDIVFPAFVGFNFALTSNNAGSKEAAPRAISKLKWSA